MTPRLVDSHCHLHFPAYDEDRDDVLSRMRQNGVWGITVGTNETTSRSGIRFAERHPDVFATVGYHPEHLTSSYEDADEPGGNEPYAIDPISILARSSAKVVAIGETGLDFYRVDEDRDLEDACQEQEFALREHIALAHDTGLPLVVHCFTGSWNEARPLIDLGLHLSFTGIVTFPSKKNEDPSKSVQRVIEKMPLHRLLVETDAPWLTPIPHRGKRNEPSYVEYVAKEIANIRKTTFDEITRVTVENTVNLFHLPV